MFVVFFIFQSSPAAPSSSTSSSSMTFVVASSHDSSSSSWDLRGKLQRGGILVASSHLGLRLHRLISTRLARRLPGRLLHGTSEEACRGQDEIGSSSSAQELNYSPPLKRPSREGPASKSTAAVNSLIGLEGEGALNGAVDSSPSSSSSLIVAIPKTRRDLSR
ncbi:hypothetical protein F2Q68_00040436 [Brassica cretica]|uniref:Uncharacterized protein n=1 Tax=Brassica cretica TaxID=69181 RepID=A0A8S9MG98_BRACR|nr:hypothetical protein F2Q68_00040436 [Brassica cretica]